MEASMNVHSREKVDQYLISPQIATVSPDRPEFRGSAVSRSMEINTLLEMRCASTQVSARRSLVLGRCKRDDLILLLHYPLVPWHSEVSLGIAGVFLAAYYLALASRISPRRGVEVANR